MTDVLLPLLLYGSDAEFEIIDELGRGGTAVVYAVRERATGRELALKVMRRSLLEDAEMLARLEREARVLARLRHPGMVPIFGVRRMQNGSIAILMDRVPGRTLKQALLDEGPFDYERAEAILADVADALGYAHEQGIVHRDVKPENIFLDARTGRALLADFGIARPIDETRLTLTGAALGTPTYMSPEQIDGRALDGRSDLYSLGVVGWEMLSGRRPWDGETLYGVIYHQKHDELSPLDEFRPDIPERLLVAIEGLLAKDPEERWRTAAEFTRQLHAPVPAPRRPRRPSEEAVSVSDTMRFLRPRDTRSWRRGALAGAGAMLAMMLAAVVVVAFAHRSEEPVALPTVAISGGDAVRSPAPGPGAGSTSADPGGSPPAVSRAAPASIPAVPAESSTIAFDLPARAPDESTPRPRVVPPPATTASAAAAPAFRIVAGGVSICLLARDGRAFCWGGNERGQLGIGTASPADAPTPLAGGIRFAALAPGMAHGCGVALAGTVYCWGANEHGQLGDGGTTAHDTPQRVARLSDVNAVATGLAHSCALAAGTVYCWGSNEDGQVGIPGHDQLTPVRVPLPRSALAITVGWNHSCALLDDATLWCWGLNAAGQLGDGTTTDRPRPVAVTGGLHFRGASAGGSHTCAVTGAGVVYCWGRNSFGQLGTGSRTEHDSPTPVRAPASFTAVAAGAVHTCALARGGAAWCWGRNAYGQLGNGGTTDSAIPVRADGGHEFVSVRAMGGHTCGTTAAGESYCWGYNAEGQLGDGTRTDRARPVAVERPGR